MEIRSDHRAGDVIPADPTYRRITLSLVTSPPTHRPPSGRWLREVRIGLLLGIIATPVAFGIGLAIGWAGARLGWWT